MMVLIWIILAWCFIKCVGWTISPFRRDHDEEDEVEYEEHHHYHHHYNVRIDNSFNTEHSVLKGGTIHGTEKETSKQADSFFGSSHHRY